VNLNRNLKPRLKIIAFCTLLSTPGLSYAAYHQVVAGDTLTQIAETNYGNWVKWKDLWKLNQEHVSNPDLIFPGQRLKLFSEDELARLAQNNPMAANALSGQSANDGENGIVQPRSNRRSNEWTLLPQQTWETFVFKKNVQVDPDGFDRRSRVGVKVADKANADSTIASDRIPILGEVINARSEYERLFLGDQIFVRADEALQVGTVYSVTTGPQKLESKRDGRVGFGYDLTGKIRIIGVRDGLFIGTVVALYYPIRRHQLLIPEVLPYMFPPAVAAATPILASMVIPEGAAEQMIGQEKIVFLDAGANDGVKPGMIFRHYLHTDPYNHEEISAKDFLIEAELKVLSVQDKFSVAMITDARGNVHYGDDLVALTDLTDYEKNQGIQTILQDVNKPTSVDELDQMDHSDGLGDKENHDLRQLEKWANPTPEASLPSADPSTNPEDDVQRIETHDHAKQTYEIGKEPAPNDGSSKPQTAPTPAPDNSSLDAPYTAPVSPPPVAPVPESTPPPENLPPPPPPEASPSAVTPAPQTDSTPPPPPAGMDAAPTSDSSGVQAPPADPFSTPAPTTPPAQ
jgi:hypothetical protein